MASLEKKIIATILRHSRKQREISAAMQVTPCELSPVALSAVKLREVQFSDFNAVAELKKRWGLAPDSLKNWERLWRGNPALTPADLERAIGWVLETEGGLVGYLGNIQLRYHYGDRTLTAVTGTGLVVEPAYRAVSLTLIAAFYRQKSADLFLTTTAIEPVGKIARAFRSDPLPQPDYETVLFWVLQPYAFAQAVMKRLQLKSTLSQVGGALTSLAVRADRMIRRRAPHWSSNGLRVSEISVQEIGDDFEALWNEKLTERPRLLADRSPATLRWHFEIPGDGATTRVFCCYADRKLRGYAVVRSDSNPRNGLKRSMIADIFAAHDDPEVLRALFAAAYEHAKRTGSEILEVLGLPQEVRRVLSESRPYLRRYPACPFFYKAADPTLHKELADGMAWYASPFDGDTTLVASRSSDVSTFDVPGAQIEDCESQPGSEVTERERTGVI